MKIIQVLSHYPPYLGGVENVAKEISERLAKIDYAVEVFTSNVGCKDEKSTPTNNLKIHYLKSFEFAHTTIIPSLFFKLLTIPKDSIIHLHVARAFVPEIVWLVSKIKNIPYIVHLHLDVGPSGKLGFLLPVYKKLFLEKILKSAKKIIVPTSDYISLVCQKYQISEKKICVIPSGVSLEKFKPIDHKINLPTKLLFVGRLSIQKNIPLLIKSFEHAIKNGCKNITLEIVGDGEDRSKIVDLIEDEKLQESVILHGVLRGEKLYKMFSNSDIFILTSREESFGIVLIEAMASGLPIIASDIPGLRNVVENGKTGLLVEPSIENFAKAIEKMINDHKLREKLITNGLREVKKYNWDKIVEKFEGVYKEVLYETN